MRGLNEVLKKGQTRARGTSCCLGDTPPQLPCLSLLDLTSATPKLCQMIVLQSPGHMELVPLVTLATPYCADYLLLCLTVRL